MVGEGDKEYALGGQGDPVSMHLANKGLGIPHRRRVFFKCVSLLFCR